MTVGDGLTGTSLVTVTGSGSVLNVSNGLEIGGGCGCGGPGVGTLTVADGAVVNAAVSTAIFAGSTLNLGSGGLSGAIVTPFIVNDGQIVANFTDTLSLAAGISGARLVVIPQCGHLSTLERPQAVNAALTEWIMP